MGTITVEEPKSVVEEVQKYECDSCGSIEDSESDVSSVFLYDGNVKQKQIAKTGVSFSGETLSGTRSIGVRHHNRRLLLCNHCASEPSNTQLEKRAEQKSTAITATTVIFISGLAVLSSHVLYIYNVANIAIESQLLNLFASLLFSSFIASVVAFMGFVFSAATIEFFFTDPDDYSIKVTVDEKA